MFFLIRCFQRRNPFKLPVRLVKLDRRATLELVVGLRWGVRWALIGFWIRGPPQVQTLVIVCRWLQESGGNYAGAEGLSKNVAGLFFYALTSLLCSVSCQKIKMSNPPQSESQRRTCRCWRRDRKRSVSPGWGWWEEQRTRSSPASGSHCGGEKRESVRSTHSLVTATASNHFYIWCDLFTAAVWRPPKLLQSAMRQRWLAPLQLLKLLGEDLLSVAQKADLVLQLLDDLRLPLHSEETTHTGWSARSHWISSRTGTNH